MAENVGSDESDFGGSVTSSQISLLKNCPFADRKSKPSGETDSNNTEVLETPISPPITRTPILSQISLDSINDEDVFRTPPENASLSSSAAESEHRVRVSQIKPRGVGSKSTTHVSASPSLTAENARVLKVDRVSEPVTEVTPLISPPPGNVRAPSPVSALLSLTTESVRVLEMNRISDPEKPVTEVTPGSSLAASSANRSDLNSAPQGKPVDQDSSSPSASKRIKVTEKDSPSGDDDEIAIPFKEIIEALLRNSGENLCERNGRVSYTDILKQVGFKFP